MTATTTSRYPRYGATTSHGRKLFATLWTVQGVLAAVFLFAGVAKLVMPAEDLTANTNLSATFLRFVGTMESLGAIGLVLPGLLKIRPGLTPLAACGLVVIMIGAVTVTAIESTPVESVFPAVVGCALVFVAYGRTRLAPIAARRSRHAVARRTVAAAA